MLLFVDDLALSGLLQGVHVDGATAAAAAAAAAAAGVGIIDEDGNIEQEPHQRSEENDSTCLHANLTAKHRIPSCLREKPKNFFFFVEENSKK